MERSEKRYEFLWKIENFNACLPDIGNKVIDSGCFASPNFTFYLIGYSQWYLEIYPKTGKDSKFLKCIPICNEYSTDCTVDCELSILTDEGTIHATKKVKCKCSGVFHCDFSNALELERSKLPPQKDLIFRCILSYEDVKVEDESTTKDIEDLSKDMHTFYLSRFLSDLTLTNGIDKLYVHRTILCIRAPRLAEELEIQDVDNFESEIHINIKFPVLKVLLKYLYTGFIDKNMDDIMYELGELAKKYNLEHLKYELLPVETHSSVNTRIISTKENFLWEIPNISSLKSPIKKLVDLQLSKFEVILLTESPNNLQLSFKIKHFPYSKEVYFRCKLSVVDKEENLAKSWDHIHLFVSDSITKKIEKPSSEKWNFPTILKLEDLGKEGFLQKGMLKLHLELEATEGKKSNETTSRQSFFKRGNENIVHFHYLSSNFMDIFRARNRPFIDGVYYDGDCYDDINLEVEGLTVGCHKAMLCARSPIFAKLFNSSSDDSIETIEVPGADYDTVLLMVQYMYSGISTNLAALEMAKLYILADRYHMWPLTKKCLSMLENSLSIYNFCDVLVLGEELQIEKLLSAVCKFVQENKSEALDSSEWKLLVDKDPVLTSRIFLKMFENKPRPRVFYAGTSRYRRSSLAPNPK